jgi:hypothetical protein
MSGVSCSAPVGLFASLLLAAVTSPTPLTGQEGRYVASPISVGQTYVLATDLGDVAGRDGRAEPLDLLAREAQLRGHVVRTVPVGEGENAPAAAADALVLALGEAGLEWVDRFADGLIEAGGDTRLLVQDPWSGGAATPDDVARLKRLREQIAAVNARAGRELAYLVPIGDAVDRLRWEVALGNVPGVRRGSELFEGGTARPAPAVEHLVAYVRFTVMYRQPATGLTALVDPRDPTSAAREAALQRIAWDAAAAEPQSGVMEEHLWLKRSRGMHAQPESHDEAHEGHEGNGTPSLHPVQMPPGGRE